MGVRKEWVYFQSGSSGIYSGAIHGIEGHPSATGENVTDPQLSLETQWLVHLVGHARTLNVHGDKTAKSRRLAKATAHLVRQNQAFRDQSPLQFGRQHITLDANLPAFIAFYPSGKIGPVSSPVRKGWLDPGRQGKIKPVEIEIYPAARRHEFGLCVHTAFLAIMLGLQHSEFALRLSGGDRVEPGRDEQQQKQRHGHPDHEAVQPGEPAGDDNGRPLSVS